MKKKSARNDAKETVTEQQSDASQSPRANKVSEAAMAYRTATDPSSSPGLRQRLESSITDASSRPDLEDEALLDNAAEALYWELDAAMDRILSKTRAVKRDLLSIRQEIALTHTLG
jgi:hypothetical protein